MANIRMPLIGDKVRIVNCKAAEKNKDRVFTVKRSPFIIDRKLAVLLNEKRGYFEVKHLEIVN